MRASNLSSKLVLLAMLEQGSVGRVNDTNVVWHGRACWHGLTVLLFCPALVETANFVVVFGNVFGVEARPRE